MISPISSLATVLICSHSGGFADIYRGTLQSDGRHIKVAIKAIKTYSGKDDDLSKKNKRLLREIRVWLNLRHANVLPLLGTTMGFGRLPAMVCPWVENGAWTIFLKDHYHNLPVTELLRILNDVASGLQYLHSCSVVHGDLSGESVYDFGLSMLLTEFEGSTSFDARGTLRWTAPELLDLEVPEDDIDKELPRVAPTTQSDVYSFGSIMLQTLSGNVSYHYYKREAQVLHAVSKGMIPKRPSSTLVTERRWVFIRRCWSTVDIARSRPSSEEMVRFTEDELSDYESRRVQAILDSQPRTPESNATRPHLPPDGPVSNPACPRSPPQFHPPSSWGCDSNVPGINVEPPVRATPLLHMRCTLSSAVL